VETLSNGSVPGWNRTQNRAGNLDSLLALIETWPCGIAELCNILALFTLTQLKFMYLAKSFIAPAIHLLFNRYSQATSHHSPMICL